MRKIEAIGLILIPLLLLGCVPDNRDRFAGEAGTGVEKPTDPPPGLEVKVLSRPDLSERTFLVYTDETTLGVRGERIDPEIGSSRVVVDDLLRKGDDLAEQNKYLRVGMWISIPVDAENPDGGKFTVKMLFTNIDIYVEAKADLRRVPFNIRAPAIVRSYEERRLEVPKPVLLQIDVSAMKAYSDEVKTRLLDPLLRKNRNYVDIPGIYYLVPKAEMDWAAIKAEIARAANPRSLEDFLIDGRLFGTWYPVENLERTSEAKVTQTSNGVYELEIFSWPADDRSHVGF